MTQEEKKLLLIDLCARLPYRVKIELMPITKGKCTTLTPIILRDYFISEDVNYLPYLRPMSSMMEEEKKEFSSLMYGVEERCINAYGKGGYTLAFTEVNDWLNANHFDYRGLIPMKLAIAVTEDNNPYANH